MGGRIARPTARPKSRWAGVHDAAILLTRKTGFGDFACPRAYPATSRLLQHSARRGNEELEDNAGIVLALWPLPNGNLTGTYFTQTRVEEAEGPAYWRGLTRIAPEGSNGWLTFIDPFHLDSESRLRSRNESLSRSTGLWRTGFPVASSPIRRLKSISTAKSLKKAAWRSPSAVE